ELRRMLRIEEAAPPPSATAVGVMTSAAPPTQAALPLAGTELSPPPSPPPGLPYSATDVGMMAPSNLGASMPPTVRQGAHASGVAAPRGSNGGSAGPSTEMAVAATMLSQPGGETGRAIAAAARGSVPGAKPPVDRAAETRAGAPLGTTQRFAQNGTAIDDGADRLLPEDDVRAALAQRYPLEVPPASGQPDDGRGELMFPRNHGYASGTGPLAGEARTRPPERGMLLPLLGAALFGAMLVGGAVLLVTKPWQKHAASANAGPPAVAPSAPVGAGAVEGSAPTTTPAVAAKPTAVTVAPIAPTVAIAPASTRSTTPRTSGQATGPAPATGAPLAAPASPPAPASTNRKPARPGSGTPRPEDVGFD
ncbi:MAG: serine/threonine protein kinase, partial [Myxococcaceae bacterium]|nr:serine/threonine protein kinase [Myxococcaceae bacterium]